MEINDLGPDLIYCILQCLRIGDFANTALVCRRWLEPSRKLYWTSINLALSEELPLKLAPCLVPERQRPSTIPRHIGGLMIDQPDISECEDETEEDREDRETWVRDVPVILNHFTSTKDFTICSIDLTQRESDLNEDSNRAWRQALLGPCLGCKHSLVVQNLKARRIEDVVPFLLGNSDLRFLGLGKVVITDPLPALSAVGGKDGDNSHGLTPGLDVSSPILDKLRHLVLFVHTPPVWEYLVPMIVDRASLSHLKMLVAVFKDNGAMRGLLRKSSASLESLALQQMELGATLDLSGCTALENLSISFNPAVMSDTVETITSSSSFKRIFINVGPNEIKPENQPEGSQDLWATLDAHLSSMTSLEPGAGVTFTMVISSCIAGMMGIGPFKDTFDGWKNDVFEFGKQKLPACNEKGLLQVVQVVGEWTGSPFGDIALPE